MMDLTHLTQLRAFLDAMKRKDMEAMLTHMADDVILKTPLAVEPFRGKPAIRPIVRALLAVVDKFEFREILPGPEHVAVFFGVTAGTVELDGMDYVLLGDAGEIRELTVLWRPLPAVVAVLNKLRAADGEPALELVPSPRG